MSLLKKSGGSAASAHRLSLGQVQNVPRANLSEKFCMGFSKSEIRG